MIHLFLQIARLLKDLLVLQSRSRKGKERTSSYMESTPFNWTVKPAAGLGQFSVEATSASLCLIWRSIQVAHICQLNLTWRSTMQTASTITEIFRDYLYDAKVEEETFNNFITYISVTANLEATCYCLLAKLSNYNCTISYKSNTEYRCRYFI